MELAQTGKQNKRTATAAFYFSISLFFLAVTVSVAILSIDQFQDLIPIQATKVLIYSALALGGVLSIVSVAGYFAGAYKTKKKR
ncbi:MAG: hypothetical protein J0652_07310 [Desulfobulbaceae bacterium]|nr:hypothetical protein [Desulfobulbaceae bacterium]